MVSRPPTSSRLELVSLGAIALAVLVGGVPLLLTIARAGGFALVALVALAFFQCATLRRDYATRRPEARLLVTRDITFLVAIAMAFAFVAHPARWADGATIAAVEFGLILELLGRRQGGSGGVSEQSSPASPPNSVS